MDRARQSPGPARDDEPTLLWLALFVGLLPVITAVARGDEWGVEPTIGLLMAVLAAAGLLRVVSRSRRPPRCGAP